MLDELMMILGQFGAAGLIGLMWILERRHAAVRERQLDEMHRQLMLERRNGDALLDVVRDNTRAISALEHSQRELASLLRSATLDLVARSRAGDGGAATACVPPAVQPAIES